MSDNELPIRLPVDGEEGAPFADWLDQRLEGNRLARQRLEAFLQEWDLLRDEVRRGEEREPTIREFAKRWNMAESTVFRHLGEFRAVFGIDYPGPVCELLWNGTKTFGDDDFELVPLLGVKVVEV